MEIIIVFVEVGEIAFYQVLRAFLFFKIKAAAYCLTIKSFDKMDINFDTANC